MGSKRHKSFKSAGLRQGVGLVLEARAAVRASRAKVWQDARESLFSVYGEIGGLIHRAAGDGQDSAARAASLISTLGRALGRTQGRAFSEGNLWRMLRFAQCYPRGRSRHALRGLSWSHVALLSGLNSAKERGVFADACVRGAWTPERLRRELVLRTSNRPLQAPKPVALGAETVPPLAEPGPDPDCAEFLGCASGLGWREALVRNLEDYILNLEAGFCLVERHKQFQIGGDDFSLDLIFFHRPLKRLFAVACRTERVPEALPDPLPLHLLWLEQNERQAGEKPPVGLLLDATAGPDSLTLRDLDRNPLPWYQSGLPPRSVLRAFFLRALVSAKEEEAARNAAPYSLGAEAP